MHKKLSSKPLELKETTQKIHAQIENYIKMNTEENGCKGANWTHLPQAKTNKTGYCEYSNERL